MQLSEKIEQEVNEIIKKSFGEEKFVGIHLRNGEDWSIACRNMAGMRNYMASPQCLDDYDGTKELTKEMCLPSKRTILEQLESLLVEKGIRNVYIATDKDPMLNDIRSRLEGRIPRLNLVHHDPWLPLIDLAVLGRSEHFIGNCVSSFTSFVKRFRDVHNKTTYFWAFS